MLTLKEWTITIWTLVAEKKQDVLIVPHVRIIHDELAIFLLPEQTYKNEYKNDMKY